MTTQNGAVTDSRQYFAYGSKRGGDDYPFEPNYTGQRRDNTGLLYYNARYYDPELGLFISPDSMISNPMDYFSYNRYLYSKGNPLKYNDPSGHCATNSDGSPDTTGDAGCWQAANEWLRTFGTGAYATEAEWTQSFASGPGITEEILRNGLRAYWSPKFQEMGIFHPIYNPPPTISPPERPLPAPAPDPNTAFLLGYNSQGRLFTRVNSGLELLVIAEGEIAIFATASSGLGVGAEISQRIYGGPVFDIDSYSDYEGFAGSVEASFTPIIGPVAGAFRGASTEGLTGPWGYYVGSSFGAGGGVSGGGSVAIPIVVYNWNSGNIQFLPGAFPSAQ